MCKRHDVFAGEFRFMKSGATVSAEVAIAGKQFAVGKSRPQLKRIDAMHTASTMMLLTLMMD